MSAQDSRAPNASRGHLGTGAGRGRIRRQRGCRRSSRGGRLLRSVVWLCFRLCSPDTLAVDFGFQRHCPAQGLSGKRRRAAERYGELASLGRRLRPWRSENASSLALSPKKEEASACAGTFVNFCALSPWLSPQSYSQTFAVGLPAYSWSCRHRAEA